MPTGSAIIGKLENIQPIDGADRIVKAECYGETVIISKDYEEGQIGILFDTDTQLSDEFTAANNMYRHSHLNEDKNQSGYIEDNRRVRAIRLKGVKCSGLWVPLSYLDFTEHPVPEPLNKWVGHQFTEWGKVPICKKYITPKTQSAKNKNKGDKSKADLVPLFTQHFSTDHFQRAINGLDIDCPIIITEKLHGTSLRFGRLPVEGSWWKRLWNRQEYKFVVGSRRVVKSIEGEKVKGYGSYYDQDIWTIAAEQFRGRLEKGETVYAEIVGFLPNGSPIMGTHSNSKLNNFMDKGEYNEFIALYGEQTVFNYGCGPESHQVYIYRITHTNEDGVQTDLSWEQVKKRSKQLGTDHVPEICKDYFTYKKYLTDVVEELANQPSTNFPQHLREGVCIRLDNGQRTPYILKEKGYYFKVLEGIIKESDIEDIEESN